ncbi:hypothetical protein OPT61_g336 [Boeremia exigua]|uniref:Uncharacterized protein n=1 Tax=Boeremia exigua TaxID=749465 RepID=A0ACC2IUG8_9PLEO|nr:hypothetical protein OPT61_g336 [Boeremia exigua]
MPSTSPVPLSGFVTHYHSCPQHLQSTSLLCCTSNPIRSPYNRVDMQRSRTAGISLWAMFSPEATGEALGSENIAEP